MCQDVFFVPLSEWFSNFQGLCVPQPVQWLLVSSEWSFCLSVSMPFADPLL
jgi:hypothetical protein